MATEKSSSGSQDRPYLEQIKEKSDSLEKFGGYDLLESAIENVQNLNPDRKARRKIFLSENNKKQERKDLLKILELWSDTLKGGSDIVDMVEKADEKSTQSSQVLKKNLKLALDETNELEASYRSVALFYKNAEAPAIKNISIVNAELEQLSDLDNTRFFDHIQEELLSTYDRLDLRDNYGLMVIPRYLGSKSVVDK